MLRFRVTQDISTIESSMDEKQFVKCIGPQELREDTLWDSNRDHFRQVTVQAYVVKSGDLTEYPAAYAELYLFREQILTYPAVHEYMDSIDTYMELATDILLDSTVMMGRGKDSEQNARSRAWSGILYSCEVYPQFKNMALEDYILQNIPNIVYAGTSNIRVRCLACLPEKLSAEEVRSVKDSASHPENTGIFDLESALLRNKYEPAYSGKSVRKYGSDVYIKDYYDEESAIWRI